MKIVCDSCGAKYSIADVKVAGKIFKIRCKKCSSVLEVRGDQTGAHPFGDANSPRDQGGEATWYIVVDGEQKGPLSPIELSQFPQAFLLKQVSPCPGVCSSQSL